ncbi:MAG: carbamoyltransferase C-terminal domain-containing protein [Candidatus Nitrosopumilus sp. bin_32a]
MNILGINEGHMSSAALISNGKLIAACCEERFTRNKNQQGYPKNAIEYCLSEGNISKTDVDYIASATLDLPVMFEATKRYQNFSIHDYVKENEVYWKPKLLENKNVNYFDFFKKIKNEYYDFSFLEKESDQEKWFEEFRNERKKNLKNEFGIKEEKIVFTDHHSGHAHYAYLMSPFRKNVLVLTADAWGDGCNCSISIGNQNEIATKFRSSNNNLARLYRNMTLYLGMKPNEHEYKVMGLAPYATDYQMKDVYEIFKNTLYVDGLEFKYNEKPTDNYYWFKEKLEGYRFDGIAGALQKYVEEMMVQWIKNAIKEFDSKTIVMSGGLALNIKINKEISQIPEVEKMFVPGGGGDESQSIGAALCLYLELDNQNAFEPPLHDYLGPKTDIENLEKSFCKYDIESKFSIKKGISNKDIAEMLNNNLIVARFSNRSEFGPRALGNRSILANPSNLENLRKINTQIKYRDFWMPFTPSIKEERIEDYLINPKKINSPFMTIAFESTKLARKDLVAAIHPSDFTLRPQFVNKISNPEYHNLIEEFEKKSGIGGLLNTSLNLHGEPVVGNIDDALHTFVESELDVLIIENVGVFREK